MFDIKKKTTVRTVQKAKDGHWYVFRKSFFGNWRIASHAFQHSTSAWACLGKMVAEEQAADEE